MQVINHCKMNDVKYYLAYTNIYGINSELYNFNTMQTTFGGAEAGIPFFYNSNTKSLHKIDTRPEMNV